MSIWVNIRSGYCPDGHMPGRANVYRASVRGLLSGQVAARSGYCPVGLLSGQVTFCRVNVHRATVCRGCVLREVSVGLVSGWATIQVPFSQHFIFFQLIFDQTNLLKISLFVFHQCSQGKRFNITNLFNDSLFHMQYCFSTPQFLNEQLPCQYFPYGGRRLFFSVAFTLN